MKEPSIFVFPCNKMHNLPKVSKYYNHDSPKISRVTITGNFKLPKDKKRFKVTCPKLVKVTSYLLDIELFSLLNKAS